MVLLMNPILSTESSFVAFISLVMSAADSPDGSGFSGGQVDGGEVGGGQVGGGQVGVVGGGHVGGEQEELVLDL